MLILAAAAVAGCASAAPAPGTSPASASGSSTSAAPASVATPAAIPPEFRAACGHPGATVEVRRVPVTVSHAACDLIGVAISYRNYGGATVPDGGGIGISTSNGFTLVVHPGSLDVTITATGVPGNA